MLFILICGFLDISLNFTLEASISLALSYPKAWFRRAILLGEEVGRENSACLENRECISLFS